MAHRGENCAMDVVRSGGRSYRHLPHSLSHILCESRRNFKKADFDFVAIRRRVRFSVTIGAEREIWILVDEVARGGDENKVVILLSVFQDSQIPVVLKLVGPERGPRLVLEHECPFADLSHHVRTKTLGVHLSLPLDCRSVRSELKLQAHRDLLEEKIAKARMFCNSQTKASVMKFSSGSRFSQGRYLRSELSKLDFMLFGMGCQSGSGRYSIGILNAVFRRLR